MAVAWLQKRSTIEKTLANHKHTNTRPSLCTSGVCLGLLFREQKIQIPTAAMTTEIITTNAATPTPIQVACIPPIV